MNTKTRCFTRLASAALACTLAICATPIWAGTIAQMPLFVSLSGVTPNVMFILDDSGSMMFEIMPEDYKYSFSACNNDNAIYLFPRANGVYGSSDYCNLVINVPSGTNTNPFGAIMRSPQWNKIYYNPAITYTPWKKYDGSSFPNASPTCAYHNPMKTTDITATGCRNVTANLANLGTTYWASCNLGTTSCTSGKSTTTTAPSGFTAATYYYYNTSATGTNPQWQLSNYTKVSITSGTYTGHGRENRTDTGCSGSSCTYTAEIQNFANWYTYYRSRVLAARAGIGKAFSTQTTGMRVGYGAINAASSDIDGPNMNMSVIVSGVRDFKEDDPATATDESINRKNFFTTLYGRAIPAQGTPLKQALDQAGKYYKRTDTRSPWVDDPSKTTGSFATYSCRKSYTILMTDGYWNGTGSYTAGAASNVDNAAGSLIMPYDPTPSDPSDDIASYKYAPVSPFKDGYSGTLADVAMYYWYQDLQPSLNNNISTTSADPAFWQHMTTYTIGLGVVGSITPGAAFSAIDTGANIAWPQPSTSGTWQNIDDLLHAAVNGHGGFFSAADPKTFSDNMASILETINADQEASSTTLASNSTQLETSTVVYQAKFNTDGWSGSITAYHLDPVLGTFDAEPLWNTHNDDSIPGELPAPASRNIYTISSGSKIKLPTSWSSLNSTLKTHLKTLGNDVGDGNNTVETSVDIDGDGDKDDADDDEKVGKDRYGWLRGEQANEAPLGTLRKRTRTVNGALENRLLGDIVNSDPLYVKSVVGTTTHEMVYVGAGDGMLHAFDANNGSEHFAYIPSVVFSNLSSLTHKKYNHKYFVDGPPVAVQRDDGHWIMVGAAAAGGRVLFAMDVTDPDNFSTSSILWEFVGTTTTNPELGHVIGRPKMGRMKDGTWAVVFGNGYSSTTDKAFLYVLNLNTGAVIAKIAAGTETANGLASVELLNDADGRLIAAYAGDLKGRLWKFDLVTKTAAFSGNPLFTAKGKIDAAAGLTNDLQHITAAPVISRHPEGGYLLAFGTGKYFEEGDHSENPAPNSRQSFYGIWDKTYFDSTSGTQGAWAALPSTGGGTAVGTGRTTLQEQTITDEQDYAGNKWRIVSQNTLDWATKRGWYLDLPVLGERVTDPPRLFLGRTLFISRVPFNPADPCIGDKGVSWFMAIDTITGGRVNGSVFDVNRDGAFDDGDKVYGIASTAGGAGAIDDVFVSGFETSAAGMAKFSLISFAPGSVSILLSGTEGMTTTADSVSNSTTSNTAKEAIWVAQTFKEKTKAALDAAKAAQEAAEAARAAANAAAAAHSPNAAALDAIADVAEAEAAAANRLAAAAVVAAIEAIKQTANPVTGSPLTDTEIIAVLDGVKTTFAAIITTGEDLPYDPLSKIGGEMAGFQGAPRRGVQMSDDVAPSPPGPPGGGGGGGVARRMWQQVR